MAISTFFPIFATKMKRLLTILFVLAALTAEAQILHFHQLTVKDGLPHNGIIALGQDAKGHIWVATFGGLLSYDGRQLHPITSDGLPDKRVDRINCAQDGTMWVRCYENRKQINRYDTLQNRFVTYNVSELSDSLRRQAVHPLNRTFADPRSSRVWTIEKRQLIETDTLQPQSPIVYTGQTAIDAGLKDETFYTLLLDRQGILWAGSANNGLFFADTRLQHYRRLICQPTPMVRATCVDGKGTLWIAIGDKQLLTLEKGNSVTSGVDYPMSDSIEGRRIRAIVEDDQGRMWLGGHDGLYVKETAASDFRHVPLSTETLIPVFCLCKDNNKTLWIGTNSGLYKLNLDEKQPQPLLEDTTVAIIEKMEAHKDGLWLTAEEGLFRRTGNTTELWHRQPTHAIVTDDRGQTWVGTDNGLLRITKQGAEPVSTAADGHIVKNLICWRDFLWCSMEQGLCVVNIYTGQSTILHTEHNEYLDGSACIDTKTGTIYFGGTLGIDCFAADSLDEQLRSSPPQLWLEEVSEELSVKHEASDSHLWLYVILLALLAIGGILAYIYYNRKESRVLDSGLNQEPVPVIPKEPSPFILKATAIAKAHIADADFTAEQMAQELAMSRTKLFLLMKKETGKAVMEFVRDIRLEYAAQQLAADTHISEIYMACGFSDPSSFRRSFAKKYGINPSQYRQQNKTT